MGLDLADNIVLHVLMRLHAFLRHDGEDVYLISRKWSLVRAREGDKVTVQMS